MNAIGLLALAVVSAEPLIDQAEKLAAKEACDDLFVLATEAKAKGDAADAKLARCLVKAAPACATKDKVIALGLTERAFALAPLDEVVVTGHATQLIASEQRGEAASVLDRLITRPGTQQREARLLRARLAVDEGEYDLALQVLDPVMNVPEASEKAHAIAAEAEAKRAEKAAGAKELETLKGRTEDPRLEAAISRSRSVVTTPQRVVWQANDHLQRGSDKTFSAKGTRKGNAYVFKASGFCEKQRKARYRYGGYPPRVAPLEDAHDMVFGVDFRVRIGQGDSEVLRMGDREPESTEISFLAPTDDVTIRVFDQSDADRLVKCQVKDLQVLTPSP